MARYPQQFIDQVMQATDIVDLAGRFIALKKAGKEFVGLCPFHDDHHPSLHVVPAKQMFYCFVCGAGGGPIKFVELYEKLPFPEAVRVLAERSGIPVPTMDSAPSAPGLSKNDLLKATAFAAEFFRGQLRAPGGRAALQYALSRGLTSESVDRFGLGFAPESWDALTTAARRKGFAEGQLVAAGLAVRREGGAGSYDRFRNRLVFPICDLDGRAVAFGGRALADDEQAKYLNSPETALFDKSNNLYALNWSRPALVKSGQAIVVEGYLDALMPLQAGVDNVVATMGTALTDRHVRLIARYATEAVLVFDADAAGAAASERAMEIFLAQQLHVRVATIPAGKDPCDLVVAGGASALSELAAGAPDALQYIWDRRLAEYRRAGGNLADRRRVVEEFLRLLASSAVYGAIDEVRRGQLAQHVGHMLNVPPADLQQRMRALSRTARPAPTSTRGAGEGAYVSQQVGRSVAEAQILEVLLNSPELFDAAAERIGPDDFADAQLAQLARCIWSLAPDGRGGLEDLLAREDLSPLNALLTRLATAGLQRGNHEATLAAAVDFLCYRRQRHEIDQMKAGGYSDETLRQIDKSLSRKDLRRHPRIS